MVRSGLAAGLLAQLGMLAGLAATTGLGVFGWCVGTAYGIVVFALLERGLSRSSATSLGAANRVTLARGVIVGGVAALIADHAGSAASVPVVVVLAAFALGLDWIDGQVARRTGTVTVLGARFDMETDAFLILVLSVAVAARVGPWVLAIGAARYLFVAARQLAGWLRALSPPRYWCKCVAAIQGIVLTVVLAGVLPLPVEIVGTAAVLALLAESFGRDIWWLWRHRGARPARELAFSA